MRRPPCLEILIRIALVGPRFRTIGGWLYRRAENLLAAMLTLMFAAFILQIVFRYLLNLPIGWTNEISVVLWIWLVLFGAAFVVREEEEIRFDTHSTGQPVRACAGSCSWFPPLRWSSFYAASLPGGRRLRHLHEGREDGVPEDTVRLALFDLHRFRRCDHRALSLAGREDAARRGAERSSTPPRPGPAYDLASRSRSRSSPITAPGIPSACRLATP